MKAAGLPVLLVLSVLAACSAAPTPTAAPAPVPQLAAADLLILNRLTWGVNADSVRAMAEEGPDAWLARQLRPPAGAGLPPQAQARIAAMTIEQRPVLDLAIDLAAQRRAFLALSDPEKKKEEQQAFQKELTRLAREAMTRSVLRALYSPWQLREQMSWFWMNHFNVFAGKAEVRAYLGDYEEKAIRPNALGTFRELLGAVARHPAMLRYLDNAQNAAGKLNENYARELMELHTLGVDGGYTQQDVQELARVLTGYGIVSRDTFRDRKGVIREGLYEFNPRRHDYGRKVLLGEPIRSRGPAELDEALDRLARHPSTARFVSRKLALYFVSDDPSPALVERMAEAFRSSGGDIPAVLRAMIGSDEFRASLGTKFKDPAHYVLSAVRLAQGSLQAGEILPSTDPILAALARLGEPLYLRQTPDGYPLQSSEWSSAGQMAARFDIARAIAYRAPRLDPVATQVALGEPTRATLEKAADARERTLLFLSSPEFMHR